jgi:hypothetical protein
MPGWDFEFYRSNGGSLDLNGNVLSLTDGKINFRNATVTHNGGGMNIASGSSFDHDSGGFTIGTLVYDGTPVAAGDYTSSEAWYSGAGTITVLPELATLVLLGLGGVGLLIRKRRKA